MKRILTTIKRRAFPNSLRIILRGSQKSALDISYNMVLKWPDTGNKSSWERSPIIERFKQGLETFDINLAKKAPKMSLKSPIVCDNLKALEQVTIHGAKLLDFGCGNGLYQPILKDYPATMNWKYVGADINPELVELCRGTFPDSRFELIGKNGILPFQDGEFDVVLVSGVLQYVKNYTAILSELYRITSEYLLITRLPVWKYESSKIMIQVVQHAGGVERHPMHIFNRDIVENDYKKIGFSIYHRDYGSEFFHVPLVSEIAVHNLYLLRKS